MQRKDEYLTNRGYQRGYDDGKIDGAASAERTLVVRIQEEGGKLLLTDDVLTKLAEHGWKLERI